MKHCLRIAILALVAMASIQVMARETGKTNYNDTVYFYDSWERMLLDKPVAVFVNPSIEVTPPYGYEYRF